MHKLWKDAADKLGIVILPKQEHETLQSALKHAKEDSSLYEEALRAKTKIHDTVSSNYDSLYSSLEEERFSSKGLQDENKLLKRENEEQKMLINQQAKRIERLKKAKK
jgi:hypothetical protein